VSSEPGAGQLAVVFAKQKPKPIEESFGSYSVVAFTFNV
jgi:hypothetical protein